MLSMEILLTNLSLHYSLEGKVREILLVLTVYTSYAYNLALLWPKSTLGPVLLP
jgi:hypothetical protein